MKSEELSNKVAKGIAMSKPAKLERTNKKLAELGTDKCREEFEKASPDLLVEPLELDRDLDREGYFWQDTDNAWEVWQAAWKACEEQNGLDQKEV